MKAYRYHEMHRYFHRPQTHNLQHVPTVLHRTTFHKTIGAGTCPVDNMLVAAATMQALPPFGVVTSFQRLNPTQKNKSSPLRKVNRLPSTASLISHTFSHIAEPFKLL